MIIGIIIVVCIVVFLIAICCRKEPYEVHNLDETVFKKKEVGSKYHLTHQVNKSSYHDEDDGLPGGTPPPGWQFFL